MDLSSQKTYYMGEVYSSHIFGVMENTACCHATANIQISFSGWIKTSLFGIKVKGRGNQFIVLYLPKCSHDLHPLIGLYTRKPFQSPKGYSRAAGSIWCASSKHCLINARYPF